MDAFQLLDLPRRPDLSEDELRSAFREVGKRVHPDAGGTEADFAKIQDAFGLLMSPSRRIKHWLVLHEIPGDERGAISSGIMDLFGEVGAILQRGDSLSRKRADARSALARALLESETQSCREEVERMIAVVDGKIAEQTSLSASLDPASLSSDAAWRLVRDLSFLEKWRAKLRECFSGLV